MEPSELIDEVKKQRKLTDDDIGSWIGLKGNTFRYRRARNALTLRQMKIIANKAELTNEQILSLFGRKPEKMDARLTRELQKIRKAISEIER